MEPILLSEAAKQGFLIFVLCAALGGAGLVIRALWAEVAKEREARIAAMERAMTKAQEACKKPERP